MDFVLVKVQETTAIFLFSESASGIHEDSILILGDHGPVAVAEHGDIRIGEDGFHPLQNPSRAGTDETGPAQGHIDDTLEKGIHAV